MSVLTPAPPCISYYKQNKLYRLLCDDSRQLECPHPPPLLPLPIRQDILGERGAITLSMDKASWVREYETKSRFFLQELIPYVMQDQRHYNVGGP